jgi:hypothetical protein
MKRLILMIISSCALHFAYAQEEIVLDSIPRMNGPAEDARLNLTRPLQFDDSFSVEEINLKDLSMFHQPLLPDYTKNPDFKKYLDASPVTSFSYYSSGFSFNPFFTSGQVFNQSTYRLNDHFSIGGNSFGAQSIFDQPKMNPTIQEMSVKGASMFIQYKVSDKFKVETRVSISNRKSQWEP